MHGFSLFGLLSASSLFFLKAKRPAPLIRSYFPREAFFVNFNLLQRSGDAPVITGHDLGWRTRLTNIWYALIVKALAF